MFLDCCFTYTSTDESIAVVDKNGQKIPGNKEKGPLVDINNKNNNTNPHLILPSVVLWLILLRRFREGCVIPFRSPQFL